MEEILEGGRGPPRALVPLEEEEEYILYWLSKIVITRRWPLLAETCSYFLLLNTIINPYYHSCGFVTDIYLTIGLWNFIILDVPSFRRVTVILITSW